uniref:Uncharacterized protein n=1 Tax=Desertifilum tharense IPPAS B-1220 TaxID=1781255 RepID=A0ACD5GR57_9CYAN
MGVGGRRELGVREIKGKAAIALDTLRTQHFLSYSALSTLHSALRNPPSPHLPILFPTRNSELGTRNSLSTQHFTLSTLNSGEKPLNQLIEGIEEQ